MTTTGTPKVWDLVDATHEVPVRRHGTDPGAVIAAVLGSVALGGALAPGLPVGARWLLVVAAGAIAVLIGVSALRRRQALASLLLAAAGIVAPLGAGVLTVGGALHAPGAVTSSVVRTSRLADPGDALAVTAGFSDLPTATRRDARAFATEIVLRLRTLHGAQGPYPTALRLSDGSIVEGSGGTQGTALGVAPADTRVVYRVTTDGSAFRVTVVSTTDPSASVSASSALVVP